MKNKKYSEDFEDTETGSYEESSSVDETVTGGSTKKTSEKIIYKGYTPDGVDAKIIEVFTKANFNVVPAFDVDIDTDVLIRIFRFKKQQLGQNDIGYIVVNWANEKDYPFLEQTGIDVIGTFTASALLDNHRHQIQIFNFLHYSFLKLQSRVS